MRSAVIVDAVRTASGKGKPGGALSGTHPVELLAGVLSALAERTGLDPAQIDDVITGCVAQVGEQSLNIGRQGVLAAGWPVSVPARDSTVPQLLVLDPVKLPRMASSPS